jgi:hypothetical protein
VPDAAALGQPKLSLVLGKARVIALTYIVTLSTGQVVYAPIGWYWVAGALKVMTGESASHQSP